MEYTKKIVDIIAVEQIFDIIEKGTTMPVKCRLKNGMNVVVKYMKNPMGEKTLINEWIGSNIADIIGLTIPEYGICDFSREAIEYTNYNEEINLFNAGKAFYTRDYSKSVPIIRGILSKVKNHEIEKIILFDHLVNNKDRHNGNLICDISNGATLYIIDNSHIITDEPHYPFVLEESLKESNILSDKIYINNQEVYDSLCKEIGYDEERLLQCVYEIKSKLTDDVLIDIQQSIPFEWREAVGNTRIKQLFVVLKKRLSMLDEIAEMIIKERRKL